MSDFLTAAATALEIAALAFVAIGVVSHGWNRASATVPTAPVAAAPAEPTPIGVTPAASAPVEIEVDEELEAAWQRFWEVPTPEAAPAAQEPAPQSEVVPESTAEPLPTTIRELRKLCTQRGLTGAGKWTKAKCLQELAAA